MALTLFSTAFANGAAIPARHTCDSSDLSPPLRWENAPAGTKAFALVVDDPDAPGRTWDHWVLYDLPATASALPEGVRTDDRPDAGGVQGVNDFKKVGWAGPCPPPGKPHRYVFRLYALDAPTGLAPRATKKDLLAATQGHVLADAELVGTYRR